MIRVNRSLLAAVAEGKLRLARRRLWLELHEDRDLTIAEIAELVERPTSTVQYGIDRARREAGRASRHGI